MPLLFNVVWFQACWFACVLVGNKAAVFILVIICIAYFVIDKLRIEWPLIIGISILGLIVDVSLIQMGVLKLSGAILPPLWLSVLWLVFATTLNHSLKPLLDKRILFLLLSLIGGPFCYQLGVRLTDIEFGYQQPVSLLALAIVWLIAGFVILKLYEKWKTYAVY